ncbi:hypothetical protein U8527_09795 [Kordia algicida OT-1]|uniref:Gram-positive cocci surface proteins LPxTG domain-containing protein n=1 Tax=Kordia algicida OT-1 TaxID=391587 RepID=A9DV96_9FLAO|nr:hypothetical protein [Kordia algicida]EDP96392.1 hypothetical protein KAOT1_03247 [Kordia algicida OT-1]
MKEAIDLLNSTGKLNLTFLILAILSIVLAIYFYIKSKKEKKPVYSLQTTKLIENNISSIEKLNISFADKPVKNLSVTKLAFWNAGKQSIRDNDFVQADRLRILPIDDFTIFDYKVDFENNLNNVKVKQKKDSSLIITFDYLDLNQGIILSIFHNGNANKSIVIKGSFIGSKKVSRSKERKRLSYFIENNLFYNFIIEPPKMYPILLFFFRIISIFILIPYFIFIFLPCAILDGIYDSILNKSPKKFHLYKDTEE